MLNTIIPAAIATHIAYQLSKKVVNSISEMYRAKNNPVYNELKTCFIVDSNGETKEQDNTIKQLKGPQNNV